MPLQINEQHVVYVYILRSMKCFDKIYVGYTANIKNRLDVHNSGRSIYAARYKPWILIWQCGFKDEEMAISFEKYLKSGSGKAFAKKHFL